MTDILAWKHRWMWCATKPRLVSILLKEEPNVPLLVIWTKQRKVVEIGYLRLECLLTLEQAEHVKHNTIRLGDNCLHAA